MQCYVYYRAKLDHWITQSKSFPRLIMRKWAIVLMLFTYGRLCIILLGGLIFSYISEVFFEMQVTVQLIGCLSHIQLCTLMEYEY